MIFLVLKFSMDKLENSSSNNNCRELKKNLQELVKTFKRVQ